MEEQILVKNIMEILVCEMLDTVLKKFPDICKCDQCKCDIVALALNQLPTKYVTTEAGALYEKSMITVNQHKADIIGAMTEAVVKVSKRPRCG